MIDLTLELKKKDNFEVNADSLNGNYPGNLMSNIPCTIGFTYARFEVDGSIKACCVSPFNMGSLNVSKFDEIWHSSQYYAWRAKFLKIHQRNFHLKDKGFSFCQVCPHLPQNISFVNSFNLNQE